MREFVLLPFLQRAVEKVGKHPRLERDEPWRYSYFVFALGMRRAGESREVGLHLIPLDLSVLPYSGLVVSITQTEGVNEVTEVGVDARTV